MTLTEQDRKTIMGNFWFLLFFLLPIGISSTTEAQNVTNQDVRTEPVAQDIGIPAFSLTDKISVLIGENKFVTKDFLAKHTYKSGSTQFGDNYLIADNMYDGAHRRLITRSIQLGDIGDPVDIRLGRAPGDYPNGLNKTGRLDKFAIVGTIGGVGWTRKGFGSYQAAIQFGTNSIDTNGKDDEYTGYMCLSTATGRVGLSPDGKYITNADTLICHILLTSDGRLIIDYNTDPHQRPDKSLEVRGNAEINGYLIVHGSIVAEDFVNKSPTK